MSAALTFPKIPQGWSELRVPILNGALSLTLYSRVKPLHNRVLFIVHGQGEQSSRYEHFAFYLQNQVDTIVAMDLPGHGLSKGGRGHINAFSDYGDAVYEAFTWVMQKYPQAEKHWLGHSLGALITLYSLLKYKDFPISSVTLSAPLLGLKMPVPKIKKAIGEFVEPFLGSLEMGNELPAVNLSRDLNVVNYYKNNPLNHNKVTPRFFVHLMKTMPQVVQNKGPFSYPVLFVVPMEDRIVDPLSAVEYFNELQMAPGCPKQLVKLEYFYHEAFNDIDKSDVFSLLANWIMKPKKG